ncbi:MAG TPA: hypothetical protein VLF62_03600 [Candidatus Saccharimonadales bacterium]|jgi:hypothetical protein|nr:hypothetical protein [Candidatus Saccharimonadales bacterium]
MATTNDNSNKPGLGSDKMSEKEKHDIQSKGGQASAKSPSGAAGSTDAAKRGGEHSHRNS